MENSKSAPLTIKQLEKHAQGRRALLTLCIRNIPPQSEWRTAVANAANLYLMSPVFNRTNIEFDATRFEVAIREQSGTENGIRAYERLIVELQHDPMGAPIVRRYQNAFAQQCFRTAFSILALAWSMSADAAADTAREVNSGGEACSTSQ